jgi:hypothetical protein
MRHRMWTPREALHRFKTLSAVAALGVVCVMGALTVAQSALTAGEGGGVKTMIAFTTTQLPPTLVPPAPVPTMPSAAPTMKARTFTGGHWPGFG